MFQRNRGFVPVDIFASLLAVYAAFVLRLEAFTLGPYQSTWLILSLCACISVLAVFFVSGVYSRFWRYASIEELVLLVTAVLLAVAVSSGIVALGGALEFIDPPVPRSIPLILLLLLVPLTAIPRLAIRVLERRKGIARFSAMAEKISLSPTLIIGAGDAGEIILREIERNPQVAMNVIGFIDDDVSKRHHKIRGLPVLGNLKDLPEIVNRHSIAQAIIAMPSASGEVIKRFALACEQAGVRTRVVPGLYELIGGSVSVNQLRTVQIEDLLRRDPVQTDIAALKALIQGKRILVTGGGGSIGSELCRQLLRGSPSELVVLGHGENSIFEIEQELSLIVQQKGLPTLVHSFIADTRDAERISHAFACHRPQLVFHAAAHKHVPLMEHNAAEAVTNNILGTQNLLNAAVAFDVDQLVMISTDKAVNPTNVMGATKRVAELLVHQAAQKHGKRFSAVRFGNVLGSRGSVVLTFKKQIAAGGPVTVTHRDMKRFFMTIPEAVQLVLQAAILGNGGEVFVLDMGEQVKIYDLANDLIRLSGLQPNVDIAIQETGLRPGEKLYEELFLPNEKYDQTEHKKVFIAANASAAIPNELHEQVRMLLVAAGTSDKPQILRLLKQLVPEFKHQPHTQGSDPNPLAT